MPNIIINNYCNQNCQYCFAKNMMAEDKRDITLDEFKKIFEWLKQSNCHQIGLIGGEPTLSPNFIDILKYINKEKENYGMRITIFTNGVCDIDKITPYIDRSYQFLVNVNSPIYVGEENGQKTLKTIEALSKLKDVNTTLGITLFPGIEDTEYILNLATKYQKNVIRVSYAAPPNPGEIDKDEYYKIGKELEYDFALVCSMHGVKMNIDCNKVPYCYFKPMERNFMLFNAPNFKSWQFCNPVVDIDFDGNAIPCFGGGNNLIAKNIFDFDHLEALKRNFTCIDMAQKSIHNNGGKCSDCDKLKTFQCQGGCLAFSSYKGGELL